MMPRYKLESGWPPAPLALMTAVGAAYARGMRYVYSSNLLELAELGHTRCPECRRVVVERHDYRTLRVELAAGCCPDCGTTIPGIWA
jgi:pyruvate formate lyase activating enzyme